MDGMEAVKTKDMNKTPAAPDDAAAPNPRAPQPAPPRHWLESLENVVEVMLKTQGGEKAGLLLAGLADRLRAGGLEAPIPVSTPYVNTIPLEKQPPYPGNRDIERRIKSLARWNAMAMVVNANHGDAGVGGHISSYASMATLYEVAYNHFFRGASGGRLADLVYFQGHTTPGNYARAFLEYRLDEKSLRNFRAELAAGGGLSSYPHPYLMPEFWQFPTVSMGLGPLMSIYQASLNPPRNPASGPSSATASRTSRRLWVPSPSPRAKSWTTWSGLSTAIYSASTAPSGETARSSRNWKASFAARAGTSSR